MAPLGLLNYESQTVTGLPRMQHSARFSRIYPTGPPAQRQSSGCVWTIQDWQIKEAHCCATSPVGSLVVSCDGTLPWWKEYSSMHAAFPMLVPPRTSGCGPACAPHVVQLRDTRKYPADDVVILTGQANDGSVLVSHTSVLVTSQLAAGTATAMNDNEMGLEKGRLGNSL